MVSWLSLKIRFEGDLCWSINLPSRRHFDAHFSISAYRTNIPISSLNFAATLSGLNRVQGRLLSAVASNRADDAIRCDLHAQIEQQYHRDTENN